MQMIPRGTDLSLKGESLCFYSSDFGGPAAHYQPNRSSLHSYSLDRPLCVCIYATNSGSQSHRHCISQIRMSAQGNRIYTLRCNSSAPSTHYVTLYKIRNIAPDMYATYTIFQIYCSVTVEVTKSDS